MKYVKYRIEFAIFLLIEFIFRAIPLELVSGFSGRSWRLLAPFTPRHRRAIAQMRLALPEKSERECDAIARDMWENLGRNFGEFFHLDAILNSGRVSTTVMDVAPEVFTGQAASVVCGCHLANWELLTMAGIKSGFMPTSVYQRMANPLVDKRVLARRAPFYPGGLLAKSPVAGARLLRGLKTGGCLAILADLRESTGVAVPFFGRLAPSTEFPALAAVITGAPVVAMHAERLPGVRFKISCERIPVQTTGDRAADVAALTAAIQAYFERAIRANPSQWMWAHRRWG